MKRKCSTSLAKAFTFLCTEIASGVKTSRLAYKSCIEVKVQVDEIRSSNWNSGAKHEAGYDAFMTGCVFGDACSHLGIDFKLEHPQKIWHWKRSFKSTWITALLYHIIAFFAGLMETSLTDLRTGKQTLESAGSNVKNRYLKILFSKIVLPRGFRSKLKAAEIRECITIVFGPSSVISTYHLDETAVFVLFNKAELVSNFLELKATLETNSDPISGILYFLLKLRLVNKLRTPANLLFPACRP